MATLNSQAVAITGLNPAFQAAAAGGDDVAPGDNVALLVRNGDASATTVTVVVPGTEHGQQRPDVPVVVPAAAAGVPGLALIGPLARDIAGSNRRVGFTYSKVTALTVAAVAL